MSKIRVGVIRGGPSSEYEVSLMSGNTVLNELPPSKYDVRDVFIDKKGVWHLWGRERSIGHIVDHIDVAFLALHGEYGEDGNIQRILEQCGVPFTGSRAFQSAMCMNKIETKNMLKDLGIKMADHTVLDVSVTINDRIIEIIQRFVFPIVVKPVRGGSSVGVTLAQNEDELTEGIRKAFTICPQVMIEEFIDGREATCGVVEDFRNESIYSLLPVEIVPHQGNTFFDFEAKYKGKSDEICPGNFSIDISQELQETARIIHSHLKLDHYSRSDFMVTKDGIYFLEVNTLPGLTNESLLPKSINAVGSSLPEFLDHIITLARR